MKNILFWKEDNEIKMREESYNNLMSLLHDYQDENKILNEKLKEIEDMCISIIGNDEEIIVSKNKLMKMILEMIRSKEYK